MDPRWDFRKQSHNSHQFISLPFLFNSPLPYMCIRPHRHSLSSGAWPEASRWSCRWMPQLPSLSHSSQPPFLSGLWNGLTRGSPFLSFWNRMWEANISVLFLGGWCCYNKDSCDTRYKNIPRLMTSSDWPQTRKGRYCFRMRPRHSSYMFYMGVHVWSHSQYTLCHGLLIVIWHQSCVLLYVQWEVTTVSAWLSIGCFTGSGILSAQAEENPHWYNSNIV